MSAPTLLVGLGGSGSKIIERVCRMTELDENSNIAFVIFDTDINDLAEIQKRNPSIYTVQTSTKQKVGEYLAIDTYARDSWFPVNAVLNNKALTEGAGQVRSVSRLAFETAVRANKMEPLKKAIQSLFKVEEKKLDQALRVIITGSLAGGTGSGLVLPVALYIQNYLRTAFPGNSTITRGFFLLPEVFYEVIPAQAERNNLKANAYAALRELDAFMMKADGKLPSQYKDYVKIHFPREAADGFEEYDVSPYDFCFLFDAQNAEGAKLNSHEQYLDHAATCIYAQSIGPMNRRSNSSEDNTIRSLARESGRNRYAGAGASILLYPFEDIRKYIALNWAKLCVSDQWLEFDRMYKDICKENARSRELGINAQNPDESTFYVSQIDSLAKNEDPFARAIVTSCARYDGVTKLMDRWIEYVNNLLLKAKEDINNDTTSLMNLRDDISALQPELDAEWSKYVAIYDLEDKYYKTVCAYVDEYAPTIAHALFKSIDKGSVEKKLPYRLETYMMNTDGKYLHPNAIRYLLINIRNTLSSSKQGLDRRVSDEKAVLDSAESNIFGEETVEKGGVAALSTKSVKLIDRLKNKPTSEQTEISENLASFMKSIDEYRALRAQQVVVTYGLTYIEKIINAFNLFYKSFETKVSSIGKEIELIERKYRTAKGSTKRYVCASQNCFRKMKEKYGYTGSFIDLDSELCENIFNGMVKYAELRDISANNKYFSKLFENGILKFYEKQVMVQYGEDIDIDIITAIEKEYAYENVVEDFEDSEFETDMYIRDVINSTRKLACPFIENPIGGAGDGINSCTYNSVLKPESGDESPRAALINEELSNYGGSPDKEISKYMIMFYKSFYGLRANDLGKFAPPKESLTSSRGAGEYYKAYFDLINHINPDPILSKEISPHIDKWWHVVTKVPDLDDGNQIMQENRIYAAFFWGILGDYISLFEDAGKTKIYRIKKEILKFSDGKLIVSNGTDCDKLYEVLDAIAIYPELVSKILEVIEKKVAFDIDKGKPVEKGLLADYLRDFKCADPGLGADRVSATSVFSLPMLMKKSTSPDSYYEDNVLNILKVEIAEMERYYGRFYSAKDLPDALGAVIKDQFEKYLNDVEKEKEVEPRIYEGTLFFNICSIIQGKFEDLELEDEARDIESTLKKLRP